MGEQVGNLPNIPVNAIAVNPNVPKQVFAGTDWGLYYTNDITATSPTWLHYNDGLPNVMIWSFSIDRGATTLAVFTRSRGAWAIPLPTQSATQTTLFSDDFEANKGWTASPSTCTQWTNTTDAHSGSTAWTTSPYTDACDVNLDSPAITVPSGANTIRLSFFEKHTTEDYGPADGVNGCPCDYGQVQLSTDGGSRTRASATRTSAWRRAMRSRRSRCRIPRRARRSSSASTSTPMRTRRSRRAAGGSTTPTITAEPQ